MSKATIDMSKLIKLTSMLLLLIVLMIHNSLGVDCICSWIVTYDDPPQYILVCSGGGGGVDGNLASYLSSPAAGNTDKVLVFTLTVGNAEVLSRKTVKLPKQEVIIENRKFQIPEQTVTVNPHNKTIDMRMKEIR